MPEGCPIWAVGEYLLQRNNSFNRFFRHHHNMPTESEKDNISLHPNRTHLARGNWFPCVQLPTTYVLIRCYVAANGWATAECRSDTTVISELFNTADDDFFQRVKTNSNHVLQPYLPQHTVTPYQLRTRPPNITLINKTKFLYDTDFVIRMLYSSHTNSLHLTFSHGLIATS